MWSSESRDINFNARNEDRSAKGAAARKGNAKGSPQRPLEGIHGKTEKWRLCSHGPRMVSAREEIRAASSTILTKKGTSRSPSIETRTNSKGDGKGDTKGRGPKGISPSGKSNKAVCDHQKWRAVPNIIRV